jgi:hypothetical protein
MGMLFLLGMLAFTVGTCHLFVRVVRWSIGGSERDRWTAERRDPDASSVIPDTVPPEWVEAYRAEHGS